MLRALVTLDTGAIFSLGGAITVNGNASFLINAALDAGGEMACSSTRRAKIPQRSWQSLVERGTRRGPLDDVSFKRQSPLFPAKSSVQIGYGFLVASEGQR